MTKNLIVHYKIRKRFKWIHRYCSLQGVSMPSHEEVLIELMEKNELKKTKNIIIHSVVTMTESDAKKYMNENPNQKAS